MPPCHGWCFECRKVSGLHTRCLLGGPRQDTVQPQPWRREQGSPLWCTPALLGKRNLWKGFPGSKIRPPHSFPAPANTECSEGHLSWGWVKCHVTYLLLQRGMGAGLPRPAGSCWQPAQSPFPHPQRERWPRTPPPQHLRGPNP